jgi:hypothetical protein
MNERSFANNPVPGSGFKQAEHVFLGCNQYLSDLESKFFINGASSAQLTTTDGLSARGLDRG